MVVLGAKLTHHDTGAAIIADGRVCAIAEERLDRVKHSNTFPRRSIAYCLQALGLAPADVDLVVVDQVDLPSAVRMAEIFRRETGGAFSRAELAVINHHDAHAASAFLCSPFDDAAILVYDGAGERFRTHLGVTATETETLYRGTGRTIAPIQKTMHLRDGKSFPYTFGIGKLYALLSEHYIGFGPYNEGKMMGLAPYGRDEFLKRFPLERWFCEVGGHILANARITFPGRRSAEGLRAGAYRLWRVAERSLGRLLARRLFSPAGGVFIEPELFAEVRLPKPARSSEVALPDEYYASVARTGQRVLEAVAVRWGQRLRAVTASPNLCVAGGVGLNIDANRLFLGAVGFERIFIQPGSSDTGIGLSCALWGWHVVAGNPRAWVMRSSALGRPYTKEEIEQAVAARASDVEVTRPNDIAQAAAELIADGKIVGWFQGGSEYGPRALGQRSILCDPRRPDMKDTLNLRVKHREPWRPFAASVLAERMAEYFMLRQESPFMLLAAPVHPERRAEVPAVTHVDGTCRIQTVSAQENGRFRELIAAFAAITGVPLLLNTSFNLAGEPMVETPAEAMACFLATEMDYLILEDRLITKRRA